MVMPARKVGSSPQGPTTAGKDDHDRTGIDPRRVDHGVGSPARPAGRVADAAGLRFAPAAGSRFGSAGRVADGAGRVAGPSAGLGPSARGTALGAAALAAGLGPSAR